ncbi:MAG TPA: GAF domain-containing sensor histidine kinase, partial [Acidimicrobiales bacterium]
EREQIRWFLVAAAMQLVVVIVPTRALPEELALGLLAFSFLVMPIVMGVAILRYRLYDIDVVLNRTIVFAALGAFITLVYVIVVVGIGSALGRRDDPNLVLSVVATAVVAVAFQPVRERVQRFANGLVYGERATPYEVLSAFLDRMHAATPPEELLDRLAQLVSDGTGATRTHVWLRVGDELRPASSWPCDVEHDVAPLDAVGASGIPAIPGVDRAVPITHHGEVLGALTIVKPRGEAVSPTDDKLVADVAAQAGLVLRNARLTAELLDRVDELRASRQRLVSAQDDERRRLERDLHDGAQQQLAAIKIYAAMAKDVVEDAGVAKAAELLDQIASFTDDALQALREVAHGIYPPLLASDGLAAALAVRTERAPFTVSIEARDVGRYPPDVEAAVYFCCLEALQNVAKYARATAVSVRVAERDGELTFAVVDDGCGFDPESARHGAGVQNMTDRLDALGGAFVVSSAPGRGSEVGGRIPLDAAVAS